MQFVIFFAAICIVLWLFLRWRASRPEFPPINIQSDDPLMLEAMARARATLDTFKALLNQARQDASVKLYFVSNSGEVEHLWAEVLEVLDEDSLGIRLLTPPVTHKGPLERLWTCSFADIEDWQIRDVNGSIHGGFSQRAIFAIARRDGITLPQKLAEMEKEYK